VNVGVLLGVEVGLTVLVGVKVREGVGELVGIDGEVGVGVLLGVEVGVMVLVGVKIFGGVGELVGVGVVIPGILKITSTQ